MISLSDLQRDWPELRTRKIFLACSGGVDSIVLLHILKQLEADLTVLHINYGLRGADSDGDEAFVRAVCAQNGIPCRVRHAETKKILAEQGGNLQETARKIRYGWFEEVLTEHAGGLVALGHHADDQVETFFQHIARKSGIPGMAGMLARHGKFIRPLLAYDKADLQAWARQNNFSWREDVSNSGDAYTRNRLRNVFLPEMYSQVPDLKSSVLTLVDKFQQTQLSLESAVKEQLLAIRETGRWPFEAYDVATAEEKVEILRSLQIRARHMAVLDQLRRVQKGGRCVVDHCTITREQNYFFLQWEVADRDLQLRIEVVTALPDHFSKEIIFLDPEKLRGSLQLRLWKTGDRMQPIGLKGTKLISDILTESGLPSHMRAQALVLTDDCDIHWCVGLKVGAKACADALAGTIWRVSTG